MTANPNHQAILAAIVRGDHTKDVPVRTTSYGTATYSGKDWGRDYNKSEKVSIADVDKQTWRKPAPEEPYVNSDFSVDCKECAFTLNGRRSKNRYPSCGAGYFNARVHRTDFQKKGQDFLERIISPKAVLQTVWDQSVKAPEAVVKAYEVAAVQASHRGDSDTVKVGLKLVPEIFKWTAKSTALEKQGSDLCLQIIGYLNWLMEHESQVASAIALHRGQYLFPMIFSLIKGYMLKIRAAFYKPQHCRSVCKGHRERASAAALEHGKSLSDMFFLAKARLELGTLNPVGEVVLPAQQPPVTLMCEALSQHFKTQLRQVLKTIRERTMFDAHIPDVATLVTVLPFLRGVTATEPQTVGRKRTHDGEPKENIEPGEEIANVQVQELVSALPAETDIIKFKSLDGKSVGKLVDALRSRAHSIINRTLHTSFDSVEITVSLIHNILLSLCRNEHWQETASIAEHLIFTLREAIEASTVASGSSSPSPALSKSLALVLGTKAVALRKSARASQGAVAAKEGASILRTLHSDGKFGRELLTLALLEVEASCCYINSSAPSAINNAISAAEEAVKVCRQAVGNGNLAVQAKPVLARALVLQARALAEGNRGDEAQASSGDGIALYRELVIKDPGLYEVQLAGALCHRADMYRNQEPLKQAQPLMEALRLYDGQRSRWAALSTDFRFRDNLPTYEQERSLITFALQKSAVDCAQKASAQAFKMNDFDCALRFAKFSEALNLINVISAKDVRTTQVHHLANALCTSGYSNLMMTRSQAAVDDLSKALKIYRYTPLAVSGTSESLDVRARAWLGAAYCLLGHQDWATEYVSKVVREIRDGPEAFHRSGTTKDNRENGETGSTALCQLLVFQAGIQIRGGQLEQAEASLTEALTKRPYSERRVIEGDYEKTALMLKARVLQAGGRVEEATEALENAKIVEGRDFGYLFTVSGEP
ncbi:hypothetical protein CF326_g6546 [Tilletia indica]|nr:hypothetical protein CF326_g6546 [Tilletia indica]